MTQIHYSDDMSRLRLLKRPKLWREWNFFSDCIGRAFITKCFNFDALTQTTQQIGYSLIVGYDYDFGRNIVKFIGERSVVIE